MGGALRLEHSGSAVWSLSPDAQTVCAALVMEAVNGVSCLIQALQ